MSRSSFVAIVFAMAFAPFAQAQDPKTLKVSGVLGGAQLTLKALLKGEKFTGDGKLTAATGQGYEIAVKSGALKDRQVRLEGTLGPRERPAFTSFVLIGNLATGEIEFSYTGAQGTPIKQSTKGTVAWE